MEYFPLSVHKMICTGKSRILYALVQAQPNFMSDGGIFVRKWILLFLILVFADVFAISSLKEHVSLEDLRKAGIPVGEMEKAGISLEEMQLYLPFWQDMEFFPLAVCPSERKNPFSFADTWMEARNYGGKRKHEGCDIFGKEMLSGYYPVISITDGTVEKVGWLPLGGWRIGIRSPGGGYFYYAHLSGYGRKFQEGEAVRAGELLGFLGHSGYGEEGTCGKVAPHLHMGVYVRYKGDEEYALNPYPVLVYLKDHTKEISY